MTQPPSGAGQTEGGDPEEAPLPASLDFGRISHDLHNRISVVAGLASLLAEAADNAEDSPLQDRLRRLSVNAIAASRLLAPWATAANERLAGEPYQPAVASHGHGSVPTPGAVSALPTVDLEGSRGSPPLVVDDGHGPITVLVVDDDEDTRILMRSRLTEAGYRVREEATGEETLGHLAGIDLVVLDYQLAGLSGLETLRQIVDLDGPPVVMVTGIGTETTAVEAMRAGAIDYLSKSADYLRSLPQVIDRALRQHHLAQRAAELTCQLAEAQEQRAEDAEGERQALAEAQRVARLGSWEWDIAADVVIWSDELYRLFGLDRVSFSATYAGFLSRVHPKDRAMVEGAVDHAYASLQSFDFEHRIVLPDGGLRWVHGIGQVVADEAGTPVRMYGTAQDITLRRRAEAKFEGLLEAAPDAIVVVDSEGLIHLVNRQTEALFGYDRSELMGQPLELLIPERFRAHHPDLRSGYWADSLARPMGAGLELAACRRDGSEFPVDISLSPLETEEGTLVSAAIRDVTDRKRAEAALAHQAMHDALTGLPNRLLLEDRLTQALAHSRRSGATVTVLFLDVDRFKVINDSRGHSVGDRLLCAIAGRLRDTVRPCDTVARFGGDEFVVVTEGAGGRGDPVALGHRLAQALAAPIELDGTEVAVTVSIGMATAGPDDDAESLLRDADAAMYRAKEGGRDRCVIFDGAMRAGATARMETESALRRAIERGELSVHYQPILDLTSGQVVGVEALARWDHPELGIVLPSQFIAMAEETGLIVPLGAAVLEQACREVAHWQRLHPELPSLSLAVNLSARQLLTTGLPLLVSNVLMSSGFDAGLLCLEITESVLLDDADSSSRSLQALKDLGVRVGVDDFGTGYSSLTYLKRFPVDTLKIDRSFVEGLDNTGHGSGDRAIVAGIIDLAHAFGLTTVAEGVETAEQLARLRSLGCEQVQGYYLSVPLSGDEAGRWIADKFERGECRAGTTEERPASVTRVMLVEDDRSLRMLVRLTLEDHGGFEIVAEASDGREAVALARHFQPEVVLLDLAMPGLGGLEALPLLLAVAPAARVIVLSGLEPQDVAAEARERGAVGYITKDDATHIGGEIDRLISIGSR